VRGDLAKSEKRRGLSNGDERRVRSDLVKSDV
jgi:hypothetical protein